MSTSVDRQLEWSRVVALAERRPLIFLTIWAGAFLGLVIPRSFPALWYDEVLTYYGALAPSYHSFYLGTTHFDFNPPLLYILERLSLFVFGESPWALRLPSALAFFGSGVCLFWFVQRQSGSASYGLLALGALFSSGFFYYASEARPYALVLFCFTLAYVCWREAVGRHSWSLAHTGLAASLGAMCLAHCFAPLFALCFAVGEIARTGLRWSDWDKNILFALLAPLPLLAFYLPLFQSPGHLLYPKVLIANSWAWFGFYGRIVLANLAPFGLALAAALLVPPGNNKNTQREDYASAMGEWAFLVSTLCMPALLIGYAVHAGLPVRDRYAICVALPIALLIVRLVARVSRREAGAALLATFLLAVNLCFSQRSNDRMTESKRVSAVVRNAPVGLPVVAAGSSRFVELDYAQPSAFASRLYYLTDREAELRYTHASVSQDFPLLKEAYPQIRGHVEPYREFVLRHKHFVVLQFPGDAQEAWVLEKLKAEGALVREVQGAPYYWEVFTERRPGSGLRGQAGSGAQAVVGGHPLAAGAS